MADTDRSSGDLADPFPQELEALRREMESDRPRVLVVAGSGISSAATGADHVSWPGLLKHGMRFMERRGAVPAARARDLCELVDRSFTPFDLERALKCAELIQLNLSALHPTEFEDWLRDAFGSLHERVRDHRLLDAVAELADAGALVLTTNYDGLLSTVVPGGVVTWKDHEGMLGILNRKRSGVIHIHGHWSDPDSVILGSKSYERLLRNDAAQAAFRSFWLSLHWVYIGCGGGLQDPNLGPLLSWGRANFERSALPDYLCVPRSEVSGAAASVQAGRSVIPVAYEKHAELPDLLRAMVPSARSWPFERVTERLGSVFRDPGADSNDPFPSFREYIDGEVPTLPVDETVRDRLAAHGWALVLDVASVGKTTLAMRIATDPRQRAHPSFVLNMASVGAEVEDASVIAAARRIAREGVLLIIDNAHHRADLTRAIWDAWKARPRGSRLLMLATQVHQRVTTAPSQSLAFLAQYETNPAVGVALRPADLVRIAQHLYRRARGPRVATLAGPRAVTAALLHRRFGRALGAFACAVLGRLDDLQRGSWNLPPGAAAEWVESKWLRRLSPPEIENVLCMAVCGAQELELELPPDALPLPSAVSRLCESGLVMARSTQSDPRRVRYTLREPEWGRLILAARPETDAVGALHATVARAPVALAPLVTLRLLDAGAPDRARDLWAYLQDRAPAVTKRVIESQPAVGHLVPFLGILRGHGGDKMSDELYRAIAQSPEWLAARVVDGELEHVASFLKGMAARGFPTRQAWEAIEADPNRLGTRCWVASLEHLSGFLQEMARQQRSPEVVWRELEQDGARWAARVHACGLAKATAMLRVARDQRRPMALYWEAIEKDEATIGRIALGSRVADVAAFLASAREDGRLLPGTHALLEEYAAEVAARGLRETPAGFGAFLSSLRPRVAQAVANAIDGAGWAEKLPWDDPANSSGLAFILHRLGRVDLADHICRVLVRRATWSDFTMLDGKALQNFTHTLVRAQAMGMSGVQEFIDALCNPRWLGWQYRIGSDPVIAGSLGRVAMTQPWEVVRRLHNHGLRVRLMEILGSLGQRSSLGRASHHVQLFGAAEFAGVRLPPVRANGQTVESLIQAALLEMSHRPDAIHVEPYQANLWAGIRALGFAFRIASWVGVPLIEQTLTLWREDVRATEQDPDSSAARLHRSMCRWLEQSLSPPTGRVAISDEPLWTVLRSKRPKR